MSGIFINYRRSDSAGYAARLYDALSARYGDRVHFDVDSIQPGVDFVQAITSALESSNVILVVIGRHWLSTQGAGGTRRLDDPDDLVRIEIVGALRERKGIIPILVDGARMPSPDELPAVLKPLASYQAVELTMADWKHDVELLFRALDGLLAPGKQPPTTPPVLPEGPPGDALPPARPDWLHDIWHRFVAGLKAFFSPARRPAPQLPPPASQTMTPPAPQPPSGHEVFVSHAKEDQDFAEAVVATLEGTGLRCWAAYRNITAGEPSWAGAIVGALATSRLVVVIVSEKAIASKQVLREVTIADDENIPFIPFCVDEAHFSDEAPLSKDFKYFFSTAQRLDAGHLSKPAALALLTSAVKQRASTLALRLPRS